MLFTEICSLDVEHWSEKNDGARDRLSMKIAALVGQWRAAYPKDKEFRCGNESGPRALCFDMCTPSLGYGYWEAPPESANCTDKLPDDHPCLELEKAPCAKAEDDGSCKMAKHQTAFARCGGVTGEAARRYCAARLNPPR